jgi:hypothetical protein
MVIVTLANGQRSADCADKGKHHRSAAWKRLFLGLWPRPAVYHPERHYMRGPGPKWRERHLGSVWAHDPSNNA